MQRETKWHLKKRIKMKRLFKITIFLLTNLNLLFGQESKDSEIKLQIDSLVQGYYSSFEASGLVVGIVKNNKDFYTKTLGYQNINSKNPLTANSIFHMASISKPVTASIIAKLFTEGQIDIDKPYIHYVPAFKMADSAYTKITVRELVTHISGMPYIEDYGFENPVYDSTASYQLVESFSNKKLLREPGKEYDYSNYAYDILAELIKQVTNLTFEDYAKENIFTPLGMKNSTFLKLEVPDSIATSPHVYDDNTFEISVSKIYPYNRIHAPSSCFHSNLNDMLIWIKTNLNHGICDGNRILPDSIYDLLFTPAVLRRDGSYVGFSWFIDRYDSLSIIHHAGGDPGYKNFLVLIPSMEVGIIVMSNSESMPPQKLAYDIIDIMQGKIVETPKKPISFPLGKAVMQKGSESARELFFDLKNNEFESYDFSRKWITNLGYNIMIRFKFDEAIEIFKLNTEVYPESAITWNSLGDGYYFKGDKENAINSYKKALEIDPNYKNALNRLKQLENKE